MTSKKPKTNEVFSAQFPSPKIIFLFGFPGTGKKTQASRLCTEYSYVHLDMKTLMNQEIKRGSEDGQSLKQSLDAEVVPSSFIRINLLKRAFSLHPSPSYVITGFLKNLSEALDFEKEVCGIKIIANFVIND